MRICSTDSNRHKLSWHLPVRFRLGWHTWIKEFNQLFTCEYVMKNVLTMASLPSKLTAIFGPNSTQNLRGLTETKHYFHGQKKGFYTHILYTTPNFAKWHSRRDLMPLTKHLGHVHYAPSLDITFGGVLERRQLYWSSVQFLCMKSMDWQSVKGLCFCY